jgi:hypothetical protein
MIESDKPGDSKLPADAVMAQPLCDYCQHDLIVHRLRIPPEGPWRVAFIAAQILLFTWATTNPTIRARLGAEWGPSDLSLALAEVGCPACYDGEAVDHVSLVLRKGIDHALQVGTRKASDPDWPIDARILALRATAEPT